MKKNVLICAMVAACAAFATPAFADEPKNEEKTETMAPQVDEGSLLLDELIFHYNQPEFKKAFCENRFYTDIKAERKGNKVTINVTTHERHDLVSYSTKNQQMMINNVRQLLIGTAHTIDKNSGTLIGYIKKNKVNFKIIFTNPAGKRVTNTINYAQF